MLQLTHDTLKQTSTEVEKGTDISQIINGMFSLMDTSKGIGLAANQVGLTIRVIVVNVQGFRTEIINPVITRKGGKLKISKEGCLSFPSRQATLKRDEMITVEGFDRNWQPIKKNCKGLLSYCVQHEIDHLNGITIL
tara:strand:+ start:25748 stop:26158 length:411 start_codon:yes stop_codon:yes gene_type:complete